MREDPWPGFPGGSGLVYYPSSFVAEASPGNGNVFYKLQWVHRQEVWSAPSASLWSKRLTSGGLSTSVYKSLHQDLVGPTDVLYGHELNCYQQGCGADAPWGYRHEGQYSVVQKGDWHNHPAWTWSQHYRPGPTYVDSAMYPYFSIARSTSSVYLTNLFWDSDAAPQDNVDYSVTGLEPGARAETQTSWEMLFPETAWGFDAQEAAPVLRDGSGSVERTTVADSLWGQRGGRAEVARVRMTGPLILGVPEVPLPSPIYRQAVVRFQATGSVTASLVWSYGAEGYQAPFTILYQRGEWQVGVLDLTRWPGWSDTSEVSGIGVAVDAERGEEVVIDVDFLILAP
jgi:hypothetical protein